ncbi:MAG: electron transfer flavoprotein subunit beta/FixA family protein [Deltaproteobacteria bacterium]|nr:electron transfer flavoprotein subunit beta/FixA family protein [Candidatus Tharpella sp.]
MNCIVCLKQTPDSEAKIVLDETGQIDTASIRYTMNPYDEYALEEALRIKEKHGGKVTVITLLAAPGNTDFITQALAMGTDQAITVCDPLLQNTDQTTIAKVAAALLKTMEFDLILCGKEAIDDGFAIFPSALAEFLDIAQINVITDLKIEEDHILATRDIDGGSETISAALPALISAQKGLNDVRYPPLSRIMRAKRMKVKNLTVADLGLSAEDIQPQVELKTIELPEPRKAGIKLQGNIEEIACQLAETIKKFL